MPAAPSVHLTESVLSDGPLRAGARGDKVLATQIALDFAGYPSGLSGEFDDDTVAALTLFQMEHDLRVDGVLDEDDRDAIQAAVRAEWDRLVELVGDDAPDMPIFFSSGPPVCVVADPQALVRSPPPALASTGEVLPQWARVQLLETLKQGSSVYVRVRLTEGPQKGEERWTKEGNLASARDIDPSLQPDRLLPSSATPKALQGMARIYNRYGGILARLAASRGYPVAGAAAVLKIESGGNGFNLDGTPVIRFENHVYKRQSRDDTTFARHFVHDSGKAWAGHRVRFSATGAWESFHGDQVKEHRVLAFASGLNETAAIESQSVGIVQVMGFNYLRLGFPDAITLYEAMSTSVGPQIDGLFAFIQNTTRCHEGLEAGDYVKFATGYNGSGQAEFYGGKISEAAALYRQVLGLVDKHGVKAATLSAGAPSSSTSPTATTPAASATTPAASATTPAASATTPAASAGTDDLTQQIARLTYLKGGPDGSGPDGIFGQETETATRAFQERHGLGADGLAGPGTLAAAGLPYGGRVLKVGRRGEDVTAWQAYLVATSLGEGAGAVRALQVLAGLKATGTVDAATRTAVADLTRARA